MKDDMKNALINMYKALEEAEKRQQERGSHDQGARSQVTGGKHFNCVAEQLRKDLLSLGYKEEDVYYENKCLSLPGWYRPSKDWDLLAFDSDELLALVELKSINSSFGNNANNRTEESLGSAVDAAHSIKNSLIPFKTVPPLIGYVLVIKICEDSIKKSKKEKKCVYPIDEVFKGASYYERLTVFGRRLLAERLYQAVWIVGVDPVKGIVYEPDENMTYEKFLASLKSQLDIHRA